MTEYIHCSECGAPSDWRKDFHALQSKLDCAREALVACRNWARDKNDPVCDQPCGHVRCYAARALAKLAVAEQPMPDTIPRFDLAVGPDVTVYQCTKCKTPFMDQNYARVHECAHAEKDKA